jgi:hypothetical protein
MLLKRKEGSFGKKLGNGSHVRVLLNSFFSDVESQAIS